MCSSWELECRGWRAIPGQRLLSTVEDSLREQEGEDCSRKYVWRKDRQLWRQGATAESCAVGGTTTIDPFSPHAGSDNCVIEKDQPGLPFECLLCQAIEKDQSGRPFKCQLPKP